VIKTRSAEDTLRIAQFIEEQWAHDEGKLAWDSDIGSTATPVSLSYVKSECRDTSETFFIGTLTQCRGISESLAKIILRRYSTLDELLNATSGEIASITDSNNPKRKVGKIVAERLFALLHNIPIEVKISNKRKPDVRKSDVRKPKVQECMIQEDE
jgi:hypothetical protein